jgi:hypothetical protein
MNAYQYLKRRRQYINKAGDVSIDTLVVLKNMQNRDNCMVVASKLSNISVWLVIAADNTVMTEFSSRTYSMSKSW